MIKKMEKNIIESLGLKLQHDNKYKCFLNLPNFFTDIFAISATFCMSELDEVDRMTLRQHVHFMIHFFRSRLKIFDLGEYDARVKLFSKEGAMITCIISKVIFCMSKRTILSVCKLCDTINFGEALPAFSM